MVINSGLWFAFAAFGLWGLFPVYWRLLAAIPADEVLAHRVVWSMIFIALIITFQRRWREGLGIVRSGRNLMTLSLSSVLIAVNWLVFIWAVNNHYVLEASLGYYINPLISVLLGVLVLREKLRRNQLAAILLAAAGVLYLTLSYGRPPWIALTLAFSFATYGLIRKTAKAGSVIGLGIETVLLTPPALFYLFYLYSQERLAFTAVPAATQFNMMASGIITAIPLLCFSEGARRLKLSTIGLMQYIAPSLQFLQAVFLFDETFSRAHFYAFGAIWTGLVIFSLDSLREARRSVTPPPTP